MSPNPLLAGLRPTHPGELLREDIIPALGISKTAVAAYLGVSRRRLCNLLSENAPVTAEFALRLGRLTGSTPEFWLNFQNEYDLQRLEVELAPALAGIPTLRAAEEEPEE